MSTSLLVLKVVGPPLAQGLLAAFDVKSKVANAVMPKTMGTVSRDVLRLEADGFSKSPEVTKIAQQMANDIRSLFEGRDRQVTINSRDAILLGLAQTLISAGLTQAGLADMNFDAATLEQHLLEVNPGVDRDFSQAERTIYQQTVAMVSRRLIEAAPAVEGYEQAKTAKMLQRLEAITRQLGLERDLAIQAEDAFVERYRKVVEDELDRLEVFGLPRMDRLTSKQSLSMAYIALSASGIVDGDNEVGAAKVLKVDHHDIDSEWPDREQRRVLSQVDEAICDCRRLMIRGGAGAGKSTLMQWLAVRAASQSFKGKLTNWNIKIPFFIRLRSLVGDEFPPPEKFPALIAKNIAAQMPEGWVHKYLDRRQALVLIDGVDELPRKAREDFFEALKDLVRDFPHATYVVTSRPSGLKTADGDVWQAWEDWIGTHDFKDLMLEPMTPTKVEAFVTQWHKALGNSPLNLEQNPEQTAQKLIRQLRQRPELQRLASTPLLCAMICALHRERLETLPSARLQLYQECIDMLLNRRDVGREISLDETYKIGLNEIQKLELLRSLALKFMRLKLSSLEIDRVDSHFNQELKNTNLPETITGRQIRELFVDRAALLREPVVGQIDFAHRTFQEYLAAAAILRDDCLEELLQKASDDQWRESIIVAAGLARPKECESLLTFLINQGNKNPEDRQYLHFLSVACLETAVKVSPETRDQVLTSAKALMPPKDDDEVAMVVRAGNEVVPLLGYDAGYSGEDASKCIEALVRIGTSKAMETLADYAKATFESSQSKVGQALGRGWDVFAHDIYISQVLSQAHYLSLDQAQVSDLSPLSGLTQLSTLSLAQTQVSDLSPLSGLTQLSTLSLAQTQVSDLSPLSGLTQLSTLSLNQTQVSDLSPLSGLTQLSTLSLDQTQVSDLSPLSGLTKLRTLRLAQTQVSDLSPLSALAQLSILSLAQTQVSDLSILSGFTQLNTLSLAQTQVGDLSPLSGLTQLHALYLDQTQVSDLSSLSSLSQLSTLSLDQTQVSDLSPLSSLTQLSFLSLDQTQVSDLSPLNDFAQFSFLSLDQTQVSDLSPLKHLKNLTIVTEDNAKAKRWEAEGIKVSLGKIEVSLGKIEISLEEFEFFGE
ncbi:NACHT domain-containing protein [Nodosilinea sp. PGN35]|uniref:NACHT domain-containing protein n=1 Tax=Nodosilinea sp. PGN35 TaxID=3020489 RepID=UPI0023B2715B|nr:leucine-rich repeat domain-containing protein [Nodosilinea sp. TSF1-S3]MDF0366797.1 NACHT domain-containing protein [Nodosilinea sp. TSF1-S3]